MRLCAFRHSRCFTPKFDTPIDRTFRKPMLLPSLEVHLGYHSRKTRAHQALSLQLEQCIPRLDKLAFQHELHAHPPCTPLIVDACGGPLFGEWMR